MQFVQLRLPDGTFLEPDKPVFSNHDEVHSYRRYLRKRTASKAYHQLSKLTLEKTFRARQARAAWRKKQQLEELLAAGKEQAGAAAAQVDAFLAAAEELCETDSDAAGYRAGAIL